MAAHCRLMFRKRRIVLPHQLVQEIFPRYIGAKQPKGCLDSSAPGRHPSFSLIYKQKCPLKRTFPIIGIQAA